VDELARLAAHDNVQRAAGAVALLRQLVDDDSRRVSQAATAQLGTIAPTASPSQLDFGHIPLGTTSAQEVTIQGSPLALASTVETSRTELRARLQGSVLHVEATSATAGPLEGWVTLKGPAGERRLDVTATIAESDRSELDTVGSPPVKHHGTPPAQSMESAAAAQGLESSDLTVPPRDTARVNHPANPPEQAAVNDTKSEMTTETTAETTAEKTAHHGQPARYGRRGRYTLAAALVVFTAAAVVAWRVHPDGGDSSKAGPPQPFTTTTLYDFAAPYFDPDDCILPDAAQAPLASGLPHTELVKCISTTDPYNGTFWCNESRKDLENNREAFLGKAVDGTMNDIEGSGAGMNAAADGVQVSFQHTQSNEARVYWDSPSRLCAAELQALDEDISTVVDFWRNGESP
jgi:hypothetical protein